MDTYEDAAEAGPAPPDGEIAQIKPTKSFRDLIKPWKQWWRKRYETRKKEGYIVFPIPRDIVLEIIIGYLETKDPFCARVAQKDMGVWRFDPFTQRFENYTNFGEGVHLENTIEHIPQGHFFYVEFEDNEEIDNLILQATQFVNRNLGSLEDKVFATDEFSKSLSRFKSGITLYLQIEIDIPRTEEQIKNPQKKSDYNLHFNMWLTGMYYEKYPEFRLFNPQAERLGFGLGSIDSFNLSDVVKGTDAVCIHEHDLSKLYGALFFSLMKSSDDTIKSLGVRHLNRLYLPLYGMPTRRHFPRVYYPRGEAIMREALKASQKEDARSAVVLDYLLSKSDKLPEEFMGFDNMFGGGRVPKDAIKMITEQLPHVQPRRYGVREKLEKDTKSPTRPPKRGGEENEASDPKRLKTTAQNKPSWNLQNVF